MKTYQLRFEFYVPSVAWVGVEGESLAQAMAASIDVEDDLRFELDYDGSTSSRLVCVLDEKNQTVAAFSDEYRDDSSARMEAELREQGTAGASAIADGETA